MTKSRYFACVALLLLLAFAFRSAGLTRQCLTNDEVIEVEDATTSWREILWCPDAFPPAYRVTLALWTPVFGQGTSARWLSLAMSVAFIPVIIASTRVIADERASLWAGFVAATNPLMIHYGQEIRAYAMYLLTASLVTYFFYRVIRDDKRTDWWGFALSSVVAAYTHYYIALLLLTMGLIWLAERLGKGKSLKNGLLAVAIIFVGCLPLLSFFIPDLRDTVGYPVKAPFRLLAAGYTYYSFVAGFGLGPSRAALHEMAGREALQQFAPWILALAVVVVVPFWAGLRRCWTQGIWWVTLLACMIAPVFLSAMLSSLMDLRYSVRYVVIAIVPLLILCGIGFSCLRNRWVTIIWALAFLVVPVFGQIVRHTVPEYANEDLLSTASFLETATSDSSSKRVAGGENPGVPKSQVPVFILSDYQIRPLQHFAMSSRNWVPLPEPDGRSEQINDEQELHETIRFMRRTMDTAKSPEAWIVLSRAFHGDPEFLFRRWIEKSNDVTLAKEFDGVRVYRYNDATNE